MYRHVLLDRTSGRSCILLYSCVHIIYIGRIFDQQCIGRSGITRPDNDLSRSVNVLGMCFLNICIMLLYKYITISIGNNSQTSRHNFWSMKYLYIYTNMRCNTRISRGLLYCRMRLLYYFTIILVYVVRDVVMCTYIYILY